VALVRGVASVLIATSDFRPGRSFAAPIGAGAARFIRRFVPNGITAGLSTSRMARVRESSAALEMTEFMVVALLNRLRRVWSTGGTNPGR
jgi:hypothetical protein